MRRLILLLAASFVALASPVEAQSASRGSQPASGSGSAATATGTSTAPAADGSGAEAASDAELDRASLLSDEQALYEERNAEEERPNRRSPHERQGVSYWSIGGSYRRSFALERVLQLFVDEAPHGLQIPQYAFEIDRRRDGMDLILSVHYADYSFEGPFRSRNNAIDKTEIISSSMRTVAADVAVLWSANFSDVFALQYGFDFGLGVLFGDVYRTEAYPSTGGPHTQDGWAPCVAPTAAGAPGSAQATDPFDTGAYTPPLDNAAAFCGVPNDTDPAGGYTDGDVKNGQQYNVRARGMLDGGQVPFFSWRLAPRLSLRIKPIRQIIMRLDAGFDLGSGLFVGAGLQYGF